MPRVLQIHDCFVDIDRLIGYNTAWGYSSAVEPLVYTEKVYGSNPYGPIFLVEQNYLPSFLVERVLPLA
jgi:hypothetical protein